MPDKNKLDLIWNNVSTTLPSNTKQANVGGNKITAINPHSQVMAATELFGPYGTNWGFNEITLDYSLSTTHDIVIFKGVFFYPDGAFPIINSVKLFKDNAKTKIDDDFAKKMETDALTKALSKLGFNADIFLGMYDDHRYVQEQVNAESAKAKEASKSDLTKKNKVMWENAILAYIRDGNLDKVTSRVNISEEDIKLIKKEADERIDSDA